VIKASEISASWTHIRDSLANGGRTPVFFWRTNLVRAKRTVTILDWTSRETLAHRVSISLTTDLSSEALEEVIAMSGKREILKADQRSQFTSAGFTKVPADNVIKISLDGKGRWADKVFVERLWRSIK
jgi:transposase InsO family protein